MIANARMYSVTQEVAEAWRCLLQSIGRLAGMDLQIIAHAAPAPLADLWQRDDKAAVFMCGLPFSRRSFPAQLLAAPVPSPPAYAGQPRYWSELVVHRDSDYRTLVDTFGHRAAFTVADSQSGYAAPLHYLSGVEGSFPRFREIVAPRITPLGALTAVIDGVADIAPVDSYAFALFEKYRPELTAQVRIVAQTAPTLIPPLICSPEAHLPGAHLPGTHPPGARLPGAFKGLQAAFLSAHEHPELGPTMEALLLERFVLPDPAAYDTLRTTFEHSQAFWRRHPLASIVHPAFL